MASSGIADFLTYTYSTWTSGGGASKFNVPQLLDEVRGLAAKNDAAIFQVPPYFAYIAKAFSVLEGIGLGIDPNYSIVKETLPYISTRIITDPSPRTAGALATFVYGEAKDDEATRVLDADRIETLLEGVKSYAGTVPAQGGEPAAEGAAAAAWTPRWRRRRWCPCCCRLNPRRCRTLSSSRRLSCWPRARGRPSPGCARAGPACPASAAAAAAAAAGGRCWARSSTRLASSATH